MASKKHDKKSKTPRMDKQKYEKELPRLQIELVSMQQWVIAADARASDAPRAASCFSRVMSASFQLLLVMCPIMTYRAI